MEQFGQLTYDIDGNVVDWGPPNTEDELVQAVDPSGDPCLLRASCWKILQVTAYARDFAGRVPYHGEHGWWPLATFWVGQWSVQRQVFDEFHGTAGWYHRVSFSVEARIWTAEQGWADDDQV